MATQGPSPAEASTSYTAPSPASSTGPGVMHGGYYNLPPSALPTIPMIHHQMMSMNLGMGVGLSPATATRLFSRAQWHLALSQCLSDFVVQLLPTPSELAVKDDVRKLLERLIKTLEADCRLLSFGSTANGFSLRNSDMDLCCLIEREAQQDGEASGGVRQPLDPSMLVHRVAELLERETKFSVKPLPHARIPIIKLNLGPSPGLPFGIACDIGFENRLALENTRLLMSYAMIDPIRVRGIVLFLKVWSKRRHINSPYRGTLSSYGYVLLVIYFLVHVKNPPVLPNLQAMKMGNMDDEDGMLLGRNVWFFDDIELLRTRWVSANEESVAELLIDFFRYFSKEFLYNTGVASIRAGLLTKDSKGWLHEGDISRNGRYAEMAAERRNRFCIEDPFETDYNVARGVTKEGLYMIRGEFMRSFRLLTQRPDELISQFTNQNQTNPTSPLQSQPSTLGMTQAQRAVMTIAQLCEEREDDLPAPTSTPLFTAPIQVAPIPVQNPYSIGSGSTRDLRGDRAVVADRLSPPKEFLESAGVIVDHKSEEICAANEEDDTVGISDEQRRVEVAREPNEVPTTVEDGLISPSKDDDTPEESKRTSLYAPVAMVGTLPHTQVATLPPAHMAPRRAQYTSPPPPEADSNTLRTFEEMMGRALQMATASSSARERESMPRLEDDEFEEELELEEGSEIGFVDARSVASFGGVEVQKRRSVVLANSNGRSQMTSGAEDVPASPSSSSEIQLRSTSGLSTLGVSHNNRRHSYRSEDSNIAYLHPSSASPISPSGSGSSSRGMGNGSSPTPRSSSTPRPGSGFMLSTSTSNPLPSKSPQQPRSGDSSRSNPNYRPPPRIQSHPSLPAFNQPTNSPVHSYPTPMSASSSFPLVNSFHAQQQNPYTIYQPVNLLQTPAHMMYYTPGVGYNVYTGQGNNNSNTPPRHSQGHGHGGSTQSSPARSFASPNSPRYPNPNSNSNFGARLQQHTNTNAMHQTRSNNGSQFGSDLASNSESTSPTSIRSEQLYPQSNNSREGSFHQRESGSDGSSSSQSQQPAESFTFTFPIPHRRKHSYSLGAPEAPNLTPGDHRTIHGPSPSRTPSGTQALNSGPRFSSHIFNEPAVQNHDGPVSPSLISPPRSISGHANNAYATPLTPSGSSSSRAALPPRLQNLHNAGQYSVETTMSMQRVPLQRSETIRSPSDSSSDRQR